MICKFYGRPFLPPDNGDYLQNVIQRMRKRIRRIRSLKVFSVSSTLLTKVLYLLVSYPLSYTWLKGEQQIKKKEIYSQVLLVWRTR